MHNVYNYDFITCLEFINDLSLTKVMINKPQYHFDLISNCLYKQRDLIQISIVCDCIDYIGLSKFINWNKLGKYKALMMALFTNYTPSNLSSEKISCTTAIKKSIANNLINELTRDEIILLVDVTRYRIQHIELIDNIRIESFDDNGFAKYEKAINDYKQFTDNIEYSEPYPFFRSTYNYD